MSPKKGFGTSGSQGTGSHAILIGVAKYTDSEFPPVPAALNSLTAFKEVLTNPKLCGWSSQDVTILTNPKNGGNTARTLRKLAREAQDVLLVYYVGHGKLTAEGQLCLAVTDTAAEDPDLTGINYEWVATALRESPAHVKITVLDCCFSGQAIEALTDSDSVADLTHASGVYTLTATRRNRTAHVPPLSEQRSQRTSFTGELLDIIETGLPDGPPKLTFSHIYPHLQRRLTARGLPRPSQRGTDTAASNYAFTYNVAHRSTPAEPDDNATESQPAGNSPDLPPTPVSAEATRPGPSTASTDSVNATHTIIQQNNLLTDGVPGTDRTQETADSTFQSTVEGSRKNLHSTAGLSLVAALALVVLALTWAIGRAISGNISQGAEGTASSSQSDGDLADTGTTDDDLGLSELLDDFNYEPPPDESLDDEASQLLSIQLAAFNELIDDHPTLGAAEADGWRRAGPFIPGLGTHYLPPDTDYTITIPTSLNDQDEGEETRPVLIFDGIERGSPLAGFMLLAVGGAAVDFAGPWDTWREHTDLCIVRSSDDIELPFVADLENVTEEMCADRGGEFTEIDTEIVHVWWVPGYDSELGLFSEVNPKITCPDGTYYRVPFEELEPPYATVCRG